MNEKRKFELDWPDASFDRTEWESTILQNEKLIAFVSFHHDPDAVNPCEDWDGFGMIRSLSNKHINNISRDEANDLLTDDNDFVIPLSYFEHGQCKWGTMGSMGSMPDFNWDGVSFAGIWIADNECIASVNIWEKQAKEKGESINRKEKFVEMAKQACETYTAYCNGEVYGFQIELYRLQFDGDDAIEDQSYYECNIDLLYEDSCWGYYGYDELDGHMKDEIINNLDAHLNSMRKKAQFDSEGEPYYNKMKQEDFYRILETIIKKQPVSKLITIPGLYEVVSEHFNNEILEEWEKEQLK